MGQLHNELRRGIWSDALKRFLGVSKNEGGLERFGETLTPVLDLWSPDLPETAYLRNETLWATFLNASALAGEFSTVAVSVGASSRFVLVVEKVLARGGGSFANLELPLRSTVAATLALSANGPFCRDNRVGNQLSAAPQATMVELWSGTDAATLNSIMEAVGTNATTFSPFTSPPWIVRPGTALVVQGDTVNSSLQTQWAGRVRQAMPGELV